MRANSESTVYVSSCEVLRSSGWGHFRGEGKGSWATGIGFGV